MTANDSSVLTTTTARRSAHTSARKARYSSSLKVGAFSQVLARTRATIFRLLTA